MKKFEEEGYKDYYFPAVDNAVKANFPYRSQLSVLMGMYRVYPEMAAYIRKMRLCAHPFMEIYTSDVIHYYAPMSKQEYFYVPETDVDFVNSELAAQTSQTFKSNSAQSKELADKKMNESIHSKESLSLKLSTPNLDESSDQAVPNAPSSLPINSENDDAGQVMPEFNLQRSQKDGMDICDTTVDRKAKSLSRSIPNTRSNDDPKLRSKSVALQKSVFINKPLDVSSKVQDSGVTSTVFDLQNGVVSMDNDESQLTKQWNISNSNVSCDSNSDVSFVESSDMTSASEQSTAASALHELSSDSEH